MAPAAILDIGESSFDLAVARSLYMINMRCGLSKIKQRKINLSGGGRGWGFDCLTLVSRLLAAGAAYVIIDYMSIHWGVSLCSRAVNFPF